MFVPEAHKDTLGDRSLPIHRLRELGRMYQSRGESARALHFFKKALEASRICDEEKTLVSNLRNLAQVHSTRKEYSEAIALYSEIWAYDVRA